MVFLPNMYRKKVRENMSAEEEVANNGFFNRLAEFPMSRVALDQLSILYERAHHQKLLAMGLSAGEITFRLAGRVASPVINKLPVDTLDSMACKQLDRLEHLVPVIRKEPKEILEASEDLYYKAKNVPSNTVEVVKNAGINTVTGVKTYAVETISPTVERVEKVRSYGVEKVNSATSYTKEKYEGVKATYEDVKSGELVNRYYNSMKDGVVHQYEELKGGVVHKYDGAVSTVSGVKTGMAESYSNAKTGIYNYTVQTVEPTVQRYTVAKTYSMEKINESASFVTGTYTGLKDMTASVVDVVTNNRMVNSVKNNGMVQSLNNSLNGLIDYGTEQMDHFIPPLKGNDEMDPASLEAGTWTRTMILMTNLRGRLYAMGHLRVKPYTTHATEMVDSVKAYKDSTSQTLTNYYQYSHDYLTKTFSGTNEYITGTYHNGLDFVNNTYKASQDRYNGAKENMDGMYTQVGTKLISIKEGTYGTFYFVHKNYDSAKDRLVMTWNNGMEKSTSLYSYISEMALFTQDMVNDKLGRSKVKEE